MARAPWDVTVFDALDASTTQTSGTLSVAPASRFSAEVDIAGGSGLVGTLQVNYSNEQQPSGLAPVLFNASHWWTGPQLPVNGNGTVGIPATDFAAKWMQFIWTPSAGTGGTITVVANLRD